MRALAVVVVSGLAFAALVFLGHLAWQYARWRRDCRAAGEKLYREAAALYGGEHEYRVVSPSEWPALDQPARGRAREALLASGLRYAGAFENLTVTRVYPAQRTFSDAYLDAEGTTCVVTYAIAGRQTVECSSRTSTGRVLTTTNAVLDGFALPPEVEPCVLAADTTPEQVLRRHHERLTTLRAGQAELLLERATTIEEVLSACQRSSAALSRHRRSSGLATEAEMLGHFSGTDREGTARRIWKEFQRCRARDA